MAALIDHGQGLETEIGVVLHATAESFLRKGCVDVDLPQRKQLLVDGIAPAGDLDRHRLRTVRRALVALTGARHRFHHARMTIDDGGLVQADLLSDVLARITTLFRSQFAEHRVQSEKLLEVGGPYLVVEAARLGGHDDVFCLSSLFLGQLVTDLLAAGLP